MQIGDFVTARLKGIDDYRQGIYVENNLDSFIILGKSGKYYTCEGKATVIPVSNLFGDTKTFVLNYNKEIRRSDPMRGYKIQFISNRNLGKRRNCETTN